MARKRSKPRTLRTELLVTIEESPGAHARRRSSSNWVKVEAMSPEQTAVVLDGSARSTSLPTPTIVTAPSVGNQPTGLPLSELVEQFYADKEGEAHESGGLGRRRTATAQSFGA
jgi:hypothetical protein